MSEQPITRVDRATRIAWLEQLAAAAAEQAAGERAELEAEARREHAQGCRPSWDMRTIGTVYARQSDDRATIEDPAKFLAWVQERHPEQIEQVVRKAYLDNIRKNVKPSGNPDDPREVVNKDGEIVPGIAWEPGGRFLGITVKLDDGAKEVFALTASMALTTAMRGEGSPFAADMRDAAEAAELLAGETPGADETPA